MTSLKTLPGWSILSVDGKKSGEEAKTIDEIVSEAKCVEHSFQFNPRRIAWEDPQLEWIE
jgi:hypothetical protein